MEKGHKFSQALCFFSVVFRLLRGSIWLCSRHDTRKPYCFSNDDEISSIVFFHNLMIFMIEIRERLMANISKESLFSFRCCCAVLAFKSFSIQWRCYCRNGISTNCLFATFWLVNKPLSIWAKSYVHWTDCNRQEINTFSPLALKFFKMRFSSLIQAFWWALTDRFMICIRDRMREKEIYLLRM